MKYNRLLTSSALLAVCSSFVRGTEAMEDSGRFLQLDRYAIGDSSIDFGGTSVTLIFPLSSLVPNNTVEIITFSDLDCTVDISDNDFLVLDLIYDSNPAPDEFTDREVTLHYTIEPGLMQTSDVWHQDQDDQYFMKFCVGFSLKSGDISDPDSVTIAGIDTGVILQVDLLGDFAGSVPVRPGDMLEENAEQVYYVEGWLCDPVNNERLVTAEPQTQGTPLRVCVKPTDEALADGVFMRRIESFTFQRDSQLGGLLSQTAVREGESANAGLTQLVCERGWELCYFDTLLNADFYFGAGSVTGFGEAWLQFGRNTPARRLRIETRFLRVETGFAGAAYFDVDFFVIPSADFAYNAVAYECDHSNQKVEEPPPKVLGESVRICVTPDADAMMFGMTISSLDSWNFTRSGASMQPAVEMGAQAENGLTILMCIPGSTLCVFRTQFLPAFFPSDGVVNGVGDVVLRYAAGGLTARRRRLEISGTTKYDRQLQEEPFNEEAWNVAGISTVTVDTNVIYVKDALPERCKYEQKVTDWWIQQPINDRYMYIGMLVGTLATIASLLLCCWACPCLGARKDQTEIDDQDVKVNVDLKSEKKENNITNTSKSSTEESKHTTSTESDKSTDASDEEKGSRGKKGKDKSRSSSLLLPDGSADQCKPKKPDVIFDDRDHPGTKKFMKVIKDIVERTPDEDYCESAYKAIMRKCDGARFFVTVGEGRYKVASKTGMKRHVGQAFVEAKRSLRDAGSSSRDLEQPRRRSTRDLDPSRNRSGRDLDQSRTSGSGRDLDQPRRGSQSNRRSSSRHDIDDTDVSKKSRSSRRGSNQDGDRREGKNERRSSRRSLDSDGDRTRSTKSMTTVESVTTSSSRRSSSKKR